MERISLLVYLIIHSIYQKTSGWRLFGSMGVYGTA